MKTNCWEAKKCGREPGGKKVNELGICPAAIATDLHGINSGVNGGRACWAIANTLCGSKIQGSFTQKLNGCLQCDFYAAVRSEEKNTYIGTQVILAQINGQPQLPHAMSSISLREECRH